MSKRPRDRKPSEPSFRFDLTLLGVRITNRSGTRSLKRFQDDCAILRSLAANGQREILRQIQLGHIKLPALRLAQQRGTLASGQLIADLAANENLWAAFDRVIPKLGRSSETRARYTVSAKSLKRKAADWLGAEAKVADLQLVDWSALHAQWGSSGSDWNRLRSFLSASCSKLFVSKRHPFRGELLDKIDRAEEAERTATFTVDEFWGVVARTPEYVQGVYVTLVATGMRWGEYERCSRDSLRSGNKIALPAPLGAPNPKKKARTIAVEKWLWPWVLQAIPCPISYAHIRKHWTRACLDAGLARYVPSERYKGKKVYEGPRLHDLRHLKGQMLIRDVDLSTVADDLGHTQLSTTRRYVRDLHQEQTAKVVGKRLRPSNPPKSPPEGVANAG